MASSAGSAGEAPRESRWAAALLAGGCLAACGGLTPTDSADDPAAPSGGVAGPTPGTDSGSSTAPGNGEAAASVEVDTVYRAAVSGLFEGRREVIRSAEAWSATWAQIASVIAPAPAPPDVDFAESQVVVVALGARPSGGYDIELTSQALTQPVLVLAMTLSQGAVAITAERIVRDC